MRQVDAKTCRDKERIAMEKTIPERGRSEKQQNIQDGFLNSARKEKLSVTVYLVSGVKLTGRIRSFDKFSLVLESSSQEQLIFKHAISTVVLPRAGSAAAAPAPAAPEG
jgi:host factor-I protein